MSCSFTLRFPGEAVLYGTDGEVVPSTVHENGRWRSISAEIHDDGYYFLLTTVGEQGKQSLYLERVTVSREGRSVHRKLHASRHKPSGTDRLGTLSYDAPGNKRGDNWGMGADRVGVEHMRETLVDDRIPERVRELFLVS